MAIAAPAVASPKEFRRDVQRAAGPGSNVSVVINGDAIALYGYVEDAFDIHRVNQVVKKYGYTNVRNGILRSN